MCLVSVILFLNLVIHGCGSKSYYREFSSSVLTAKHELISSSHYQVMQHLHFCIEVLATKSE